VLCRETRKERPLGIRRKLKKLVPLTEWISSVRDNRHFCRRNAVSLLREYVFWEEYFFSSRAESPAPNHRHRLRRCFRRRWRRRRRRPVTAISPKNQFALARSFAFSVASRGRRSLCSPHGFPPVLFVCLPPALLSLRAPCLAQRRSPPPPLPSSRTLPVKERTFFCFLSREILDGHDGDNVGFAADSHPERKRERERGIHLYFLEKSLQ